MSNNSFAEGDVEEHVLRVARLHRRASMVVLTLTDKMSGVMDEADGDVVRAVAQAITQNFDVSKMIQQNESDFIARILACGIILGSLPADDEGLTELREEINRLPDTFTSFLETLNQIIETGGESLVEQMSRNPAVAAEYAALQQAYEERAQGLGG